MSSMYVYYEEFTDSTGAISLIEIVLSSYGSNTQINWKDPREKAAMDIINAYLKSVPADKRSYDATSHIWSFLGSTGVAVIQAMNAGINGGLLQRTSVHKITDLQDKASKGQLSRKDKPKKSINAPEVEIKFNEEEFFYNTQPPTEKKLVGEALWEALGDMLGIPMEEVKSGDARTLKKAYFRAAMKYHPDRNNGDGSKMSELNMLWGIYNS